MDLFIITLTALIIDYVLADPRTKYHPVVLIGKGANSAEKFFRKAIKIEIIAGTFATATVTLTALFITFLITKTVLYFNHTCGLLTASGFLFFSIGCKSLINHANDVYVALKNNDLPEARKKVALITSRDTSVLDKEGVIRSCLESVGENVIDGTTAVFFYSALGWLYGGISGAAAGAVLYRTINTLDAIYGYRNDRYRFFGTFAAKTDDLLNYIPARMTFIIIAVAAFFAKLHFVNSLKYGWRDCRKHPSPNSGYGMASFAGALGVQLGGPTIYKDKIKNYPFWGEKFETISINHIKKSCFLSLLTSYFFALLTTLSILFF